MRGRLSIKIGICLFAISAAAVGIVVGCGLVKDDFAPTSDCSLAVGAASADSEQKFNKDIYPILSTNCRQCHNGPNPIGPNRVGDTDIEISRTDATARLTTGALASRGTDGHCQGCSVANDPAQKANFKTQLDLWLQLVRGASGYCPTSLDLPDNFTASVGVPTGVNGSTFTYARIPLESLGYPGAFIDVGVKSFAEGFYEFGDFRAHSPKTQIDLAGMKAWVTDGTSTDSKNTLSTYRFTVPRRTGVATGVSPVNLPPITTQSLIIAAYGVHDQIKLSFTKTGAVKACKAFSTFKSSVLPIVNNGIGGSGACIACHGDTTNTAAFSKFPISLADEQALCLEFRWRLGGGLEDSSSLMLKKLQGAQPPHPITFTTDSLQPFRNWRSPEFP